MPEQRPVRIPLDDGGDGGGVLLDGDLLVPQAAAAPPPRGVVLFAHGSGSGRHSPRNRYVADVLNRAGMATLLLDLLTPGEEAAERHTRHLRFDIGLLAGRLRRAARWLAETPGTAALPLGLFGASTGGGAALAVAAEDPGRVRAVVSRGGRPDLAGEDALGRVLAPTLLIVGGDDAPVIAVNRQAMAGMRRAADVRLEVVPHATHLFEEPGALEEVARLAADWFRRYLGGPYAGEGGQP